MRWEDERYVRLYTRDTLTWKRLGWEGRAVLPQLMRKVDRAGIVEIGNAQPGEALGLLLDMPQEITDAAWPRLIATETVTLRDGGRRALCLPNFIEAQEAKASGKARTEAWRERQKARDSMTTGNEPLPIGDKASPPVTLGDEAQPGVTPSCAVPSLAVPKEITQGAPQPVFPAADLGISRSMLQRMYPVLGIRDDMDEQARQLVAKVAGFPAARISAACDALLQRAPRPGSVGVEYLVSMIRNGAAPKTAQQPWAPAPAAADKRKVDETRKRLQDFDKLAEKIAVQKASGFKPPRLSEALN